MVRLTLGELRQFILKYYHNFIKGVKVVSVTISDEKIAIDNKYTDFVKLHLYVDASLIVTFLINATQSL